MQIVRSLTELTKGNLETQINGTERKDEVGQIAKAALVFRDQGREILRLRAEQDQGKIRPNATAKRRWSNSRIIWRFGQGVVDIVSSAATQMQATAQALAETADQTSGRSRAASAAADETSASVQTVATASEELATLHLRDQQSGRPIHPRNQQGRRRRSGRERDDANIADDGAGDRRSRSINSEI